MKDVEQLAAAQAYWGASTRTDHSQVLASFQQ